MKTGVTESRLPFLLFTINFKTDTTLGEGFRIIVECQNYAKRENFAKRALAYSAMAISDQLKPRMNFEYNKVYFIGLLNYNQFKNSTGPITKVRLFTEDNYELADDNYLQIYVELRKLPNDLDVDFPTLFLKAIRDIGKGEKEESAYSNDKRLETLFNAARFGLMPKEQQDKYKEDMTYESDYKGYLEDQVNDAREDVKREIAGAMKKDGISSDSIVKYTGLTLKEIEEL